MRSYRVYLLRGRTRRAYHCLDFFAADDEAAVQFVRNRQGPDPLEIWSQGQKVARLEAV